MTPLEQKAREIICLITGGDMATTPWQEYAEEVNAILDFARDARGEALEEAMNAIRTRHDYTEQAPCPDGDAGCCVLHYRTVNRVPMTRNECLEAIRSLLSPQGGKETAASPSQTRKEKP